MNFRGIQRDPFITEYLFFFSKYRLVKNPIAVLLPESDISRFYSGQDSYVRRRPPYIYALHVNYAGNEMHESHVRVRIQSQNDSDLHRIFSNEGSAEERTLELLSLKGKDRRTKEHGDTQDEGQCFTIAWLLYLGYLLWVERDQQSTA